MQKKAVGPRMQMGVETKESKDADSKREFSGDSRALARHLLSQGFRGRRFMENREAAAYLERLEYKKEVHTDRSTLEGLIRSHLEHVPFENLDVLEKKLVPNLTEEALFDKVVRRKRGGYCFELNTLFRGLLEHIGYQLYPVAVRILWNKTQISPRLHMGLVVQLDGEKYICDVGYGGPGPKGLMELKVGEQEIDGALFRRGQDADGEILLERLHHGEWKPLMCFQDIPVKAVDFKLMNFYASRNEECIFTRERIVNLCTPHGSKALTGMELTVRNRGIETRTVYKTEEELSKGLEKEFGITGVWP